MNPTGSGLERATACPASLVLPQARETNEANTKGDENHLEIENAISSGDLSKVPDVVRDIVESSSAVDVEVAFALDVATETVRLIGRRLGRKYGPLAPTEIALTIDAIVDRLAGPWVVDWKSRKRVTPASRNLQIRAGVVAVMTYRRLAGAVGAIAYLDDGEIDSHTFDAFDVASFWSDMRAMLDRVRAVEALVARGATPEVHAGPWCEYCPAISHCPTHTRLALSMLGEIGEVEKQVEFLSVEQCGRAWELLKQVQRLSERVETSLKLRARQEPIPLPSGKRLAVVECRGRMGLDRKAVEARYADLGEALPMKRGADYVQTKEV